MSVGEPARTVSEPSEPRASTAGRRDPVPWRIATVPATGDLAAAQAYCRQVAARHYENFTVATRLVPRRLRQHLANVYAYARWSDDLADEAASPRAAASGLAEWRHGLEACFAGQPCHPIYVALADTIRRTGLTIEPFSDLLSAFEEDQAFDQAQVAVRYATRTALLDYCSRSADPVGRIVLALEGCRDPQLIAMSDAICTGLQLVNFWQDVCRDRRAGRVYLPAEDLERHGVEERDLDAPQAAPRLKALVRDEVAWARSRFDTGAPLVDHAPAALRPAIRLFLAGGRALAAAIEGADYDTLRARPTVTRWTKLRLACNAWWEIQRMSLVGRR